MAITGNLAAAERSFEAMAWDASGMEGNDVCPECETDTLVIDKQTRWEFVAHCTNPDCGHKIDTDFLP